MSDEAMISDLRPAADRTAALVAEVTPEQLSGPTPCEEFSVAAILDHLVGLATAFTAAATKTRLPISDTAPQVSADNLDPDWRNTVPRQLAALAQAWRDPAAWNGETTAGGVTMPAAVMGKVALNELVIHGWDLARATGQPYDIDSETGAAILPFLRAAADEDTAARAGLFGPVVPVPQDAPLLDVVVGLSGRDPDWRP